MYKKVSKRPEWLKTEQVHDIYSVSACVSEDFTDWVNYWKHNGYWFFDCPEIMEELAQDNDISLSGMELFFYKVFEEEWDDENEVWVKFDPENSFETNVISPKHSKIVGYDIVNFSVHASAECSLLSCNHMAQVLEVNSHCLFNTIDKAKGLVEANTFKNCEPGPYRIFEVHKIDNTNMVRY